MCWQFIGGVGREEGAKVDEETSEEEEDYPEEDNGSEDFECEDEHAEEGFEGKI